MPSFPSCRRREYQCRLSRLFIRSWHKRWGRPHRSGKQEPEMKSHSSEAALAEPRKGRATSLTYVLVTPARNEAAFIEQTIEAVVGQTIRPAKWVIVSDGSTDGTDEIVKGYAAKHNWIELVRMPERRERHFAGKVGAFNAGYARVRDLDYDVIGNLDADISFDEEYL